MRDLPATVQLDLIFGLHETRSLKKDGSFVFGGTRFEIPRGPRYGDVTVVLHPPFGRRTFTQLSVLWKNQCLRQWIRPAGSLTWRPL